jgi:hypothetical protein
MIEKSIPVRWLPQSAGRGRDVPRGVARAASCGGGGAGGGACRACTGGGAGLQLGLASLTMV